MNRASAQFFCLFNLSHLRHKTSGKIKDLSEVSVTRCHDVRLKKKRIVRCICQILCQTTSAKQKTKKRNVRCKTHTYTYTKIYCIFFFLFALFQSGSQGKWCLVRQVQLPLHRDVPVEKAWRKYVKDTMTSTTHTLITHLYCRRWSWIWPLPHIIDHPT